MARKKTTHKGKTSRNYRTVKINNTVTKRNKLQLTKLILFGVFILVVMLGSSYAVLTKVIEGSSNKVKVTSGIFQIDFSDGNEINLNNAYPMTDEEGLNIDSYTFKIKNTGNVDAKYNVSLEEKEENTLDRKYVKYSIREKDGEWSTPALLSNGLVLLKDQSLGEKEEVEYELKIWLDINAGNDTQEKKYEARIAVETVQDTNNAQMSETPIININGDTTLTIKKNSEFIDPGILNIKDKTGTYTENEYEGTITKRYEYESNGETEEVEEIDTSQTGVYYIYYIVEDSEGRTSQNIRVVNVVEEVESAPTITLIGEREQTLLKGEEYVEPGYSATDSVDGSITDKVVVEGKVNKDKKGIYVIKYIVENSKGITYSTTRTVEVIQPVVEYNYLENGGSSATKISAEVAPEATVDLTPTATKENYEFVGWNTNKDAHAALNSLTIGEDDITLYAIYKKVLTATFEKGSNVSSISSITDSCDIYNNEETCSVDIPSMSVETGYTSLGFSQNKGPYNGYSSSYEIGDNVVLYANTTPTTTDYDYAGTQANYVTPATGTYKLETWGAQGGNAGNYRGGYGAYSVGNYNINNLGRLYLVVGEKGKLCNAKSTTCDGGYNGGGSSTSYGGSDSRAGGGGGATHIALDSGELKNIGYENAVTNNKLIIASGAGGGGNFTNAQKNGGDGGDAGGNVGSTSKNYLTDTGTRDGRIGNPGTQSNAGVNSYDSNYNGSFGQGGTATLGSGGGAGLFGGAAANIGPGGGGSGYIGNSSLENKHMTCYDCDESTEEETKTDTTTLVSTLAQADYAKAGNGYAKITLNSATVTASGAAEEYQTHTVTYNYSENGGTSSTLSSGVVLEGEDISLAPRATKTGYTFVGWNTNKNATTGLSSLTMGDSDVTLYAIYKANRYTAVFDSNGGDNSTSIIKDYGAALGTLPTTNRTGYTFDGWYTAESGGSQITSSTTMPLNGATYYAHWTANTYTLTASTSIGSIPSTTGWTGTGTSATKTITYDNKYGTLPTPTATGYKFEGWEKVPNGFSKISYLETTGSQYINTLYYPKPTTGVYADFQFTEVSTLQQRLYGPTGGNLYYNFYINGNGKWAYSYQNSPGNWISTGATADTSRHKLNFNTYGNGKINIDGNAVINNAISGSPTNTASMPMTIFSSNTGSTGKAPDHLAKMKLYEFKIYESGSLVRHFVPVQRTSDSKTGLYETIEGKFYIFNSSSPTTYEKTVTTSSTVVKTTNSHTITAKWRANNYTLTLNPNGGSGSNIIKNMIYGTKNNNVVDIPTRAGYTFNGWYTAASGGTQVYNASGQNVNASTYWTGAYSSGTWKYTGNVTLYAHWTLTKYYFLSGSNMYTSTTGGWTANKSCTESYCSAQTTNALMSIGYANQYASVATVNKIDITNYKKIYFTYDIWNNSPSSDHKLCTYYIGITTNNGNNATFTKKVQITNERFENFTTSNTGKGTSYIDVSGYTGSYYIKIYTLHNTNETWYNYWAKTTQIYATYD